VVGEAKRMRHLMNIVDCEDAHGNTPLSEASSNIFSILKHFLTLVSIVDI